MMKKLLCIAGALTVIGTAFAADADTSLILRVLSEVKQYDGSILNVDVSNSETVASLKKKILKNLGLNRREYELMLIVPGTGVLSDNRIVSEFASYGTTMARLSPRSEPLASELDTAYSYFQNLSDQEISTLSNEDMQQVFGLQSRLIDIVQKRYQP